MTAKTYDIEVTPAGTALTTANTGANQVTTNGGTAVSTAAFAAHGSTGAEVVAVLNQLDILRFAANASNATMSLGFWFTCLATPASSGSPTIFQTLRYTSGVLEKAYWTNLNSIVIDNGTSSAATTIASGVTPGLAYYLSVRGVVATTTTGKLDINLYNNLGVQIGTLSSTTWNLGTNPITGGDFGVTDTSHPAGTTVRFDYPIFNDGSTAEILPVVSFTSGSATSSAGVSGTATGSPSFTGSATGTAGTSGTATGSPSFTGATTNSAAASGTAVGSPAFTGSASGTASATGSAVGSPTFSGSATGYMTATAEMVGYPSFTGSASGTTGAVGTAGGVATPHRLIVTATLPNRVNRSTLPERGTSSRLLPRNRGSRLV